jgi:hypothetical protein
MGLLAILRRPASCMEFFSALSPTLHLPSFVRRRLSERDEFRTNPGNDTIARSHLWYYYILPKVYPKIRFKPLYYNHHGYDYDQSSEHFSRRAKLYTHFKHDVTFLNPLESIEYINTKRSRIPPRILVHHGTIQTDCLRPMLHRLYERRWIFPFHSNSTAYL